MKGFNRYRWAVTKRKPKYTPPKTQFIPNTSFFLGILLAITLLLLLNNH